MIINKTIKNKFRIAIIKDTREEKLAKKKAGDERKAILRKQKEEKIRK